MPNAKPGDARTPVEGSTTTAVLVWLFRGLWVLLPIVAAPAFANALDDSSAAVQRVAAAMLWLLWFAALVGSFVPTALTLTVLRMITPAAPIAAAAAWANGSGTGAGVAAVVSTIATTGVAFTAEVGGRFVQGSAYGDERRFPLRAPAALVTLLLPIGWLVSVGLFGVGALMAATADQRIIGIVLTVIGAVLTAGFARRAHRLSRRFAVLVPSGFVLHDHFVLADTAMFRRNDVRSFSPSSAASEAADLTGKALGASIEVRFADSETVVLAGTLQKRNGTAIHLRSARFVPSRPGAFLIEAKRRGYSAIPPASTNESVGS
jgi:hypothetical protein